MADTDQVLNLAAIIREVDGSNNKGAAALAESILDHPRFRAVLAGEPAEPPLYARQTGIGQWEGADHPSGPWRKVLPADLARWGNPAPQPAAVTGQPSDEELADTYWKAWHEYHDRTNSVLHSVGLRAVLARWGNPVPAPPVEGEWQTGLPPFAGFYYVRGLLNESIGGDNRPVYVNPKHFVWGFWEQDDPEWIGLDGDITPDNIEWKPVAPLPSPVADGEVAELVEDLREQANHGYCEFISGDDLRRAAELVQRQVP